MHSLRRVAVRSAASAGRVFGLSASARQQFSVQLGANGSRLTKASALSVGRYFSQIARVANFEQSSDSRVLENAAQPDEQTDATRGEGKRRSPDASPHGVFIRNLVFDVKDEDLKEMVSQYGEVVECRIGRDARGLSKGYGFAFMNTAEEQQRVVQELDGIFWHGRRISAANKLPPKFLNTYQAKEPTQNLYIGNIPYESTDAELNSIFDDLENMTAVRVAVDRVTGWPRGFAHADFADVESAQKAKKKLEGIVLKGRELKLDFAEGSKHAASRRPNENQRRPTVPRGYE